VLGFKETPPIASDLFLTRDKHISHLQLLHRRQAHMAAEGAEKKNPSVRTDESCGTSTSATMRAGLEIPSVNRTTTGNTTRCVMPSSQKNSNDPSPASSSIASLLNEVKSLESHQRQHFDNSLQDRLLLSMIREREMNTSSTNPLLGLSSTSLPQTEQQLLENLLRNRTQSSAHPMMGSYAQSSAAMEHALQAEKEALMKKLLHLSVMPSHITEARSLLSSEGGALRGGALRHLDALPSSIYAENASVPLSLSGYNPSSLLQAQHGNHRMDVMQKVIGTGISNQLNNKADIMKRAIEALDRPAISDTISSRLGQELAASIGHSPLSRHTQASLEAQILAERMGHGRYHC